MGEIRHYHNGIWTIYTTGEDLNQYTGGTPGTYYIGTNEGNSGIYTKINPNGDIINLEDSGRVITTESGTVWLSENGNACTVNGVNTVVSHPTPDVTDITVPTTKRLKFVNILGYSNDGLSASNGTVADENLANQTCTSFSQNTAVPGPPPFQQSSLDPNNSIQVTTFIPSETPSGYAPKGWYGKINEIGDNYFVFRLTKITFTGQEMDVNITWNALTT